MSIFDLCPPAQDGEKLSYFNFSTVGDAVEGTLVDRRRNIEGKFGKQDAFGIKTATGEVLYVSAKHASAGFFGQMDQLVLGQIIGLKYVKDIPTTKGNPYKFIHLAQDPTIVDVAWNAEREAKRASLVNELNSGEIKMPAGGFFPDAPVATPVAPIAVPVAPVAPVAAPVAVPVAPVAAPVAPVIPIAVPVVEVQTVEIPVMAPVVPVMTDQQKVVKIAQIIRDQFGLTAGEDIKAKVVELTTLPMITSNLDAIIAKLG